jgi:6-pyruvoyltetrahydropterin/6-carboxytetrahydropterin synthase
MLVTKYIEIDVGHRVPNHKSKCRNFHGHRYKVELGVDDKVITKKGSSDEGMVIDFSDLKKILMEHIDKVYDHGFIMYEKDKYKKQYEQFKKDGLKVIFVPFIPTAENLAKHWFEILLKPLERKKIKIKHVQVWETPTSTAIYSVVDLLLDVETLLKGDKQNG